MAYRLSYSDYPGTAEGPPDPERWVGPPGPQGIPGPQGATGATGGITSGTMTGPLYWTATGGTVSRAAQDRSADIANVLDFGADPTGVADSAPAFNAAAARLSADGLHHRAVYAPAGTYRLNGQVTLTAGQTLFGDGRGSTILTVDQAFSASASAVISLGSVITGESGCVVRDLAMRFAQPSDLALRSTMKTLAAGGTSGTGGTGVMYPPAIVIANNQSRSKIMNVRVGGAWVGIRNTSSTPLYLDNIEMGALNIGMDLTNHIGDFCHLLAYHFWPFDLIPGGVVNPVFNDGQTIALQLGDVNAFEAHGICTYNGRIVFTSAAQTGWFHITNLMCDTDMATLEIGGAKWLHITNFYSSCSATGAGKPRVNVQGPGTAFVTINNWWSSGSGPNPQLAVTYNATDVTISNATMFHSPTGYPAVLVSGGTLRFYNSYISLPAGTYTAPVVSQTAGALLIDNVEIGTGGAVSGSAVTFATDNTLNYLGHVTLSAGMTINLPASYTLGSYSGFNPLTVDGTGSASGANIKLIGDGATTPAKSIRAHSGSLQFINNAYSNAIMSLSDAGNLSVFGSVGFNNAAPLAKPTISGACAGNTAIKNLLTQLANYGLITDGTSA